MKTITKEYAVYQFGELKGQAMEKAYNLICDQIYEDRCMFLEEDLLYKLQEIDPYHIFDDVDLTYSFDCRCDGVSFSSTINLPNYLKNIYSHLPAYKINAVCEVIYKCRSVHNNRDYAPARADQINVDYSYYDRSSWPLINKLCDQIIVGIEQYYLQMCKDLYLYGKSLLDINLLKDDASNYADDAEYVFLSSGKLFIE
jgi:hypothetical protein